MEDRKPGRPKYDNPKTRQFLVRLTPEQKEDLEVLAILRGVSKPEVLRTLAERAISEAKESDDWPIEDDITEATGQEPSI